MIDNTYAYRELLGKSSASSFGAVSINVASPEVIRSWSFGEVKNPETINYRSFKPEKGGLFCERIFGPTRDWECNCGKYKRVKHKGIVCDRCGVEVTQAKVRRERMGHIELAVPVSHIWFFKCMPSRIGLVLDMTAKSLEHVIYYEEYVVTDPGDTPLKVGQTMNEIEYRQAVDDYGDAFTADMGAPAIKTLLERVDLPMLKAELEVSLEGTRNKAIRKKLAKRLRLVEGFMNSNSRPEWMILTVLPVIPPDLRPLVPLEGGRFATSDLNDLYRRVINRNNRLKNLLQLRTPEVIIRNEKRMLQEAVDSLMDNGRHGRAVTGAGNRALKSLSDMLKGKQGRFRQNLLGKRVDYSGRSVIVVGPELKIHQCGLPKKMAMILFEPFIIRHLKGRGFAHTVRGAKKMIERGEPEVWDILEEVTQGHPVMLNRAPTLHRLSIQAFDPVLIEGSAIRLHPLVCTAYNADFDGDQMAVHVPLSNEAQMETKLLMLAPNNIFSPANGKPIVSPTQDITLGSYYLTCEPRNKEKAKLYRDFFEVLYAMQAGFIKIHDAVRIPNPDYGKDTIYGDKESKYLLTTPGRCLFHEIWDPRLGFFNQIAKKKDLGRLISDSYNIAGHDATIRLLDDLKDLGYRHATLAGLSISIADLQVPEKKEEIIEAARAQIDSVLDQYNNGLLTEGERHNKVIDIWTQASNAVANELFARLEAASRRGEINPVYAMLDSGARGSKDQIRQLAGMRGLMADPSGRIIDRPIKANFREGLTVLEYFISTHGARKGLADTALRTADSGYLTRRLVDVAQDVIVREDDCDVVSFNLVKERSRLCKQTLGASQNKLRETVVGRNLAAGVANPVTGDLIAEADTVITEDIYNKLIAGHVLEVTLYATDDMDGEATETVAINISDEDANKVLKDHLMRHFNGKEVAEDVVNAAGEVLAAAKDTYTEEMIDAILADGTVREMKVRNNAIEGIEIGAITEGKNKQTVIESLRDRIVGRNLAEDILDENGNVLYHINDYVTEDMADKIAFLRETVKIRSVLNCKSKVGVCRKCYGRNLATDRNVDVGEAVGTIAAQAIGEPGTQLTMRTFHTGGVAGGDDITQGLPRVEELFEARKPKHPGILAEVSGTVHIAEEGGQRKITITDKDGMEEVYAIPYGAKLAVTEGQEIEKGDRLTEGSLNPHDIIRISGVRATQRYLVQQVLGVYKSQGVEINDKHIEVMVRQMMRKVRVDEAGDTSMLPGEYVDIGEFEEQNSEMLDRGLQPAEGHPILLGITKASLATDSFLSAASFQETTRVLTDAAIKGKVDPLLGLKENVIIGKLIPAGTGMSRYRDVKVKYTNVPAE